jgi:hypothetical protein
MPDLNLKGLPDDVKRSAFKLVAYTDEYDPPKCDADWPALPTAIGVPAEHLVVLFARLYNTTEDAMRRLIQGVRLN